MATSQKAALQKYQKASNTKKRAPDASSQREEKVQPKESLKAKASKAVAKKRVDDAIETISATSKKVSAEEKVKVELEKELVETAAQSNKLVKGDFSPVNTDRTKLIVEYGGLIKFIASKIAARLPSNIELDDLISSGVIGLMDAIDKYDSSRDNKFKTYAEFRIRGAILDELRSQDWVPRSVREKAKILERAYSKIEQEKGRQATDDEVCISLGMTTEQYHDMLNEVRSVSLLSYDDLGNLSNADKRSLHGAGEAGSKVPTPFSEVSVAHLKRIVSEAITDLPEKQRLVLSLYYYEDLNLKEIGRVLDVTESRVSQLHSQAIFKLKARLKNHWDDFVNLMI
ncbi:MAG: FliA/WhiG family RNA polymerase sigma factor [Bdellovibrionales bacterium]|nr:FliA/WhiG family RNA polymerase sigma factor [Bdellovibrionales bacterium]